MVATIVPNSLHYRGVPFLKPEARECDHFTKLSRQLVEQECEGLQPTGRKVGKWVGTQRGRNEERGQDCSNAVDRKGWRRKIMRRQNLEEGE